ncbi:MAG TPA: hypothetical protein VLC09_06075 [Polyangiaceae bacterium]|nr:hypothetical protein [Polyangiaceae bacterium]
MSSVAGATRERGSLDTGWIGRAPTDRRLVLMLVASLAVHALISFGPRWAALAGLWSPTDEAFEEPAVDAIPVDLLEERAGPEPAVEPPPPTPPEPVAEPSPAEPKEPAAPKAPAAPRPEPARPTPPADKPADKPGEGSLDDPVARAGLAGKAVDSNANVRLLLHMGVVRAHPLGARIGVLLERTPQWNDFFGAAGVDALNDVDHILVAGPQLRDSSNVVAVVQHRLSSDAVNAAFERLVARGGEWVEHQPPLVKARADRADRLFVAPNARVVAVVPPSAEKSARALSRKVGFPPAGTAALEAYVVTPWRVARGTGFKVPDTLRWARFEAEASESGGAIVQIEAEDESEELALEHAASLEKSVRAASTLDLGGGVLGGLASLAFGSSKQRFIERIQFVAHGKRIEGRLEFTRKQLATLLDLADAVLPPPPPRERFEPSPATTGDASGTTAPGAPAGSATSSPSGTAPTGSGQSTQPSPSAPAQPSPSAPSQATPAEPRAPATARPEAGEPPPVEPPAGSSPSPAEP